MPQDPTDIIPVSLVTLMTIYWIFFSTLHHFWKSKKEIWNLLWCIMCLFAFYLSIMSMICWVTARSRWSGENSVVTLFFLGLIPSLDADSEKTELAPATPQSETEPDAPEDVRTEPDVSQEQTANENGGETIFSYERLISKSTDPVSGIDYKRREVCTFYCILKMLFWFITAFPWHYCTFSFLCWILFPRRTSRIFAIEIHYELYFKVLSPTVNWGFFQICA